MPAERSSANPTFHRFTVRREIEIQVTTQNGSLTQRDAEFYVNANFYVRGELDRKYSDFCLARVKMNYYKHQNQSL